MDVGGCWRQPANGSLAEGVGFEPTLRFPVNTLSKRAPSATRPPLLIGPIFRPYLCTSKRATCAFVPATFLIGCRKRRLLKRRNGGQAFSGARTPSRLGKCSSPISIIIF